MNPVPFIFVAGVALVVGTLVSIKAAIVCVGLLLIAVALISVFL